MDQENSALDIREILFILKKHWKFIAALGIIFSITGFLASNYLISPKYEADATLVVNAGQSSQSSVITYDQLNTAQELVNTCAVILKSDTVMDQVIRDLKLNITSKQLIKTVSISGVSNTEVLDISVRNKDPKIASYIANDITKVAPDILVKTVKASSVEVVSAAKVNNDPVSPNVSLYTLIAFLAGLFLAVALSILVEILDNTFTAEEDIQKYLGLTVLGVIPSVGRSQQK